MFKRLIHIDSLTRILGLFVLVAFLVMCLSGCGAQSQQQKEPEYYQDLMQEKTLTVLMPFDDPPFSSGSIDNATGYDVAIAQELASRLGLDLQLVNVPSETIVSVLACEPSPTATETDEPPVKQGDIAIAALAITPERDDLVNFSDWYYVGDQAVVTLDKAYKSTNDFKRDKTRIAVVKGRTSLEVARSFVDENLIAEYSTAQNCLQALRSNEVQAVVLDGSMARYLVARGFSDMHILEHIMTGEPFGIAVPNGADHLKDAINEALAEMLEDGTLDRLEREYLK